MTAGFFLRHQFGLALGWTIEYSPKTPYSLNSEYRRTGGVAGVKRFSISFASRTACLGRRVPERVMLAQLVDVVLHMRGFLGEEPLDRIGE